MTSSDATNSSAPGRRVFVIGATGGVGRRLTALLVEQGHDVTGLHRSADRAGVVRDAGANPVQGDIAAGRIELGMGAGTTGPCSCWLRW